MPEGGIDGEADQRAIRQALDDVLAWDVLRRSPQLAAFLSYIVEARLRGDTGGIKAYSIAVDVFGRDEDFDPQADPIVRVQARRLRGLLETYYSRVDGDAPIRIHLPVGRYVPEFVPRRSPAAPRVAQQASDEPREAIEQDNARNVWIVGSLALIILILSLIFWPALSERTGTPEPQFMAVQPQMPHIIVEEFENIVDDGRALPLTAGLAVQLVTGLGQSPDLTARYGGTRAEVLEEERDSGRPLYMLSGVASRTESGGVQYAAVIRSADTNATVAVADVQVPFADGLPTLSIDAVVRALVLRLTSPQGPIHRAGREWVMAPENASAVLSFYPCVMAYYVFRENRPWMDHHPVADCAERALSLSNPIGGALLARIEASLALRAGLVSAEGEARLSQASTLSDGAVTALATSGFAWEQRGHVAFFRGETALARQYYNTALHLNPSALYALADQAFIEAATGHWDVAEANVEQIFAVAVEPPSFFHAVPALRALREGNYGQAAVDGEKMLAAYPHIGAAVLVAAGGHMGDLKVINAHLPQLLAAQNFRQMGILPFLRRFITDQELLRQFGNGIARAGVPIDRLGRPF